MLVATKTFSFAMCLWVIADSFINWLAKKSFKYLQF